MLTVEKVKQYIAQHSLLNEKDTVLVAISGGADSVCLLHILMQLHYQLHAVHCNFHLRGEESNRDERFVREFCDLHHIPLHVQHFDTAHYASLHQLSIEMAAREQRYTYFESLRNSLHAQAIAIAHHQEDNAETLLLNLIRGTGLRGLCGIRPKNGHVVRPLLSLSRQVIIDYLHQNKLTYVTDSTNLSNQFARNKIRLQVIPLLQQINPAAVSNIITSMENLSEVEKIYHYTMEEYDTHCVSTNGETLLISTERLLRCVSPLSLLHETLSPLGFNRSQIKEILAAVNHTGKTFHSSEYTLFVNREYLEVRENAISDSPTLTFPLQNGTIHIGNHRLTLQIHPYTPDFHFSPDPHYAYFDADKLDDTLSVRTPQTADRFVPFGMNGSKLISDFLTNLKLSRCEKQEQLLLLSGDTIAWVIGIRSSHPYRVTRQTKRVVEMKWEE